MAQQYGENYSADKFSLRSKNDFFIKELKLISFNGADYDLRNVRVKLSIQSDIFKNTISGSISIIDGLDIPTNFPLIGEEKVKIVLTRPDESGRGLLGDDYKMVFRVYKMAGRTNQNDKTQTFKLYFVSPEHLKIHNHKIRKVYKDMPYSDMVDKIYGEFVEIDKPILIEATEFDQKFVVSNTNAFETINTLASRSISAEGNGWCYLFYEDMDKFNFVSLGKLLDGPVKQEYGFGVVSYRKDAKGQPLASTRPDPESTGYGPKEIAELRTIQEYGWVGSFDVAMNQATGMYNSKLWTYDFVRQIWVDDYDFDYEAEFNKFKHLSKENIYTGDLDAKGNPLAHVRLRNTNKDHDRVGHIVAHEPGILPYFLEEYIQRRTSQLMQVENAKITLTVSGDPRRRVGDVIEFFLPEVSGKVTPEIKQEFDKYFKGKWLIVALNHRLEQDGYWMDMQIVKDTFESAIEHIDLIDRYKDIMRQGELV